MTASIKVHLYQVVPGISTCPIEQAIEEVHAADLEDRLRIVGQTEIRLDNVETVEVGSEGKIYLLDFIRLRFDHGPGKVSRDVAVEGFDLTEDQGFGEETAALYDPAAGYMLVQYNHFGVRASSIRDYFSNYNPGVSRAYEFRPKLDETSEAKLAAKQVLTGLHFKIATSQVNATQRAENVSLGQSFEMGEILSAETVEVKISAGRGLNSMLNTGRLMGMINAIKRLVQDDNESSVHTVEKFEIIGRNGTHERQEAVDMLTPKLQVVIDGIVMGEDRRYTLASRWLALRRARLGLADQLSP